MLSTRSVIILVVLLAVLSLTGMLINLSAPPDQGGLGRNSYGTKAYGHRGVYELLETLKLPVRRGLVPPNVVAKGDVCLVFWDSDPGMVRIEPGHLSAVSEWLAQGGQVIVAPARAEKLKANKRQHGRATLERDTSVLQELGLGEVKFAPLKPAAIPLKPSKPEQENEEAESESESRPKTENVESELVAAVAQASGELHYLATDVKKLEIAPAELQILNVADGPRPSGTVTCLLPDRSTATVAGLYHVGSGSVTVISDPALLDNLALSKDADNAVFGAEIFAHANAPLLFDEFYHGLTIRGNVFWLLTRPGYGILFAMIALTVALWAWREATTLGPPLPDKAVTRRSVGEYVDAMARLFRRGNCQLALVGQTRAGVLWAIARKLGLRTQTENVERVALALERRDRDAAQRLRAAVANTDGLLHGKRASDAQIVEAMEQLRQCL